MPEAEARQVAAAALFDGNLRPLKGIDTAGWTAALPFLDGATFCRLTFKPLQVEFTLYCFWDGSQAFPLDGTGAPFLELGAEGYLNITEENAPDYLWLFCIAMRGEKGPFQVIEVPEGRDGAGEEEDNSGREADASAHAELIEPIRLHGYADDGRLIVEATVFYDQNLYRTQFAVDLETGAVEMLGDDSLTDGLPEYAFGKPPTFHPIPVLRAILLRAGASAGSARILEALAEMLLERALGDALLEDAVGERLGSRLLRHFNRKVPGKSPLDRFTAFVAEASPVVALESRLPFIEETVAEIVRERSERALPIRRPSVADGDDTQLSFPSGISRRDGLVLLPFHAYRGIVDVERIAYELAAHDPACLIGCARTDDLPPSIQQVVDLRLELPALTPDLFADLFERVMDTPPPEGWDEDGARWTAHVHHSDFQHPQGLELDPEQALDLVRERATRRLSDIEPEGGLRLDQLHGLGAARQFAEDLITDLHEAIEGNLEWARVDRGVLLAGAPGTGKTTLARAIATDCGIRFINASAASWQAQGHLGNHIRAIRSDFQRARQHAPAILFIDEIDSIGSRETFSGKNTQYHTQVVNAVLEQIQGMDPEAPVVVIGATNYPKNVDPALRRAGRLDRTIEIPRPNAKALADIFRHYLEEYVGNGTAEEMDLETVGGLALGLTGADVELVVRGALRRARRAGRPIRQQDLIDEVTRKPRSGDTFPRMTPEEVRRVAVHEAGHALASRLSETRGEDLSYVSIVPRADGTLGFVARMPSERRLLTRQEYLGRLEVMLGGRAAEEVLFGADEISGGAGQDLEVATRAALKMTTQLGLGPEGNLFWSEEPTDEQKTEANRILSEAYEAVLANLQAHEEDLTALTDLLEESQELTGDEVRAALG
jgi:AAA+ superfamily predicted ATPase